MEFGTQDIIAFAGIISTAAISILSLVLSNKRHKEQVQREDNIRKEEITKYEEKLKKERIYMPQIEFKMDANFYGPQNGYYVAEFIIRIINHGHVLQHFDSINLRVRGIKKDMDLQEWEKDPPRLKFDKRIFKTNVIAKRYGFIFVEPNIHQDLIYATRIADDFRFLVVMAEFTYGKSREESKGSKHSAERVYEIRAEQHKC